MITSLIVSDIGISVMSNKITVYSPEFSKYIMALKSRISGTFGLIHVNNGYKTYMTRIYSKLRHLGVIKLNSVEYF